MANELVPNTAVDNLISEIEGCFINPFETEQYHGVRMDDMMDDIGFLPPPRESYKSIAVVVYDEKKFYESGGSDALKRLSEQFKPYDFTVRHEISSNERIAINPNDALPYKYRTLFRISLRIISR